MFKRQNVLSVILKNFAILEILSNLNKIKDMQKLSNDSITYIVVNKYIFFFIL